MKKEKELRVGQNVTEKEILRMGWKKKNFYLTLTVFHKGEKTLFFNPATEKVDQVSKNNRRKGLKKIFNGNGK